MTTSPNGRKFITDMEGCKLVGYSDQRGIPTCCVGHTGPDAVVGQSYTPEQCDAFLGADLATAEGAVNRLVKAPLNSNQFDALVSLTYNIGQGNFADSTVLKMLNLQTPPNYEGAAQAFLLWNRTNGQVNPGLVNRREAERTLFLTPDSI